MFGKIIGAGLGAKAAEHTSKIGGPLGAVIGATAPVILRRMSIPAMLAIGAGGYFLKKYMDKKDDGTASSDTSKTPPATSTAPAVA